MALSVLGNTGNGIRKIDVVLSATDWADNSQTINNEKIKASGSAYIISPESDSYLAYTSAGIYADDVTSDNYMTFHCASVPENDITVSILKVQVG